MGIIAKGKAAIDAMRVGSAVADAVRAKNWGYILGISGTILLTISEAVRAFFPDTQFQITPDQASSLAASLITLGGMFGISSSEKIGILPAKRQAGEGEEVNGGPTSGESVDKVSLDTSSDIRARENLSSGP